MKQFRTIQLSKGRRAAMGVLGCDSQSFCLLVAKEINQLPCEDKISSKSGWSFTSKRKIPVKEVTTFVL